MFSVIMCGMRFKRVKKAKFWKDEVFELWCLRALPRESELQGDPASPSQGEIECDCSLEGLMLKLVPCFGLKSTIVKG